MKPHHIPQADSAAELFQAAVAQGGMPVIYTDGCWDKKIPRAFCATGYDQIFYRGGLLDGNSAASVLFPCFADGFVDLAEVIFVDDAELDGLGVGSDRVFFVDSGVRIDAYFFTCFFAYVLSSADEVGCNIRAIAFT